MAVRCDRPLPSGFDWDFYDQPWCRVIRVTGVVRVPKVSSAITKRENGLGDGVTRNK